MNGENILGHRLITQNMLASASLYERVDKTPWQAIQDLSTIIDLICLYDKAVVLGRTAEYYLSINSEFLDYLKDIQFIEVESSYNEKKNDIAITASKHLVTFLGEEDSDKFLELLDYALKPESTYKLDQIPDGVYEIEIGKEWLYTTPTRKQLLNQLHKEQDYLVGTTFLLRTFVYFAYADVMKIAFTPDSVRVPVLEKVLKTEEEFRGKLLQTYDSTYRQIPRNPELLQRTSPLSAIVFMRANSDKKNIIHQIEVLRNDLKPIRDKFKIIEHDLLGMMRDEEIKVDQDWKNILKDVEQNFGLEPQRITLKQGLDFAENIGGIIVNPTSLLAWNKLLHKLPFDSISRHLHGGPVIELHRLKSKLPGTYKLNETINRLFNPS